MGMFLDRFGPRLTSLVGFSLVAAGGFFLGFSHETGLSHHAYTCHGVTMETRNRVRRFHSRIRIAGVRRTFCTSICAASGEPVAN